MNNKFLQTIIIVSFLLTLIFGYGLAMFEADKGNKQWLMLNTILASFFLLTSCLALAREVKNDDKKRKDG